MDFVAVVEVVEAAGEVGFVGAVAEDEEEGVVDSEADFGMKVRRRVW